MKPPLIPLPTLRRLQSASLILNTTMLLILVCVKASYYHRNPRSQLSPRDCTSFLMHIKQSDMNLPRKRMMSLQLILNGATLGQRVQVATTLKLNLLCTLMLHHLTWVGLPLQTPMGQLLLGSRKAPKSISSVTLAVQL